MTVSNVLTEKDKYMLNILFEKMNSYPTNGEIVWRSLQLYFAKLAGRVK